MLLIEKGVRIFHRWNNFSAVAFPSGLCSANARTKGSLFSSVFLPRTMGYKILCWPPSRAVMWVVKSFVGVYANPDFSSPLDFDSES